MADRDMPAPRIVYESWSALDALEGYVWQMALLIRRDREETKL